jgi:hypothetical protein
MSRSEESFQESIVDQVNDLKAENAELRRSLIVATTLRSSEASFDQVDVRTIGRDGDFGPGHRIQDSAPSCRACTFLESQVDRLLSELESLRKTHADVMIGYETKARQLMDTLSRENHRRTRMESIIQRQQVHLRELTQRIRQLTLGGIDGTSDDSHFHYQSSGRPYSTAMETREPEVWEFDMDDLNRQLTELDDNLNRVEESSNRLSSSTRMAFSQAPAIEPTTYIDEPTQPRKTRGMLLKLMGGL